MFVLPTDDVLLPNGSKNDEVTPPVTLIANATRGDHEYVDPPTDVAETPPVRSQINIRDPYAPTLIPASNSPDSFKGAVGKLVSRWSYPARCCRSKMRNREYSSSRSE